MTPAMGSSARSLVATRAEAAEFVARHRELHIKHAAEHVARDDLLNRSGCHRNTAVHDQSVGCNGRNLIDVVSYLNHRSAGVVGMEVTQRADQSFSSAEVEAC